MPRSREQEREKFRRRLDWPHKARCEAMTSARNRRPSRGGGRCQFMGYYDPVEGGFRCGHHGDR